MLASHDTKRPETVEELLGRELMSRLDRLDVLTRKVFSGKLPGERRSKKRGQSVEFDDYRQYVPGDDLRHIDWNVLARFDKFFLKLFREEEDLGVQIVLDCSASMDAGSPSKLIAAARAATALGYVGLVNQNRVSVSRFGRPGDTGLRTLAALRGRGNFKRVASFILEGVGPLPPDVRTKGDAPDFNEMMRTLALTRRGKGVLILISDGLFREGFLPGLNFLAGDNYDAYFVQVLSPDELDPTLQKDRVSGDLRFTDAETGAAAEVTVSADLIKRYRARLESFLGDLEAACRARSIRHLLTPSDTPVDVLVLEMLRKRGLLG